KAAHGDGVTVVPKMDWSHFTSTGGLNLTTTPLSLNGTPLGPLTQGTDLKAGGGVSLDILGFVVGKANFTFAQGTSTVNTHNTAIGNTGTLTNANVLA